MASEHDAENPLSVVLVSGGLDSCVTAAIAQNSSSACFLHVNYGQRTEARERKAYSDIADHYQAPHRLEVSLEYLQRIGGSSLTDSTMAVSEADLASKEIPSSYVPFRNANLLSIAVSWAEVLGAQRIFIGAVGEDASGYPDCRPVFYEAFNAMISTGTKPGSNIRVETPIISMTKAEIVQKALALGAPIDRTWSCYQAEEEACGVCDSCAFRLRGFQQAGVEDPLPYATRPDYCA